MKFENKVAIVAGGARDIGRAVSEKLAAEGEKEKSGAFELVSQSTLQHPALLQYLTKRGVR